MHTPVALLKKSEFSEVFRFPPCTSVDEHFLEYIYSSGEFDPGSERTLAACLTHASRARKSFGASRAANG